MTRSAFVSSCGDPFLILFTHKLFKERWYDEVDEFIVCYNNHVQVPQDVIGEVLSKLSQDPKVHIVYHPRGIGNGMPITEMTLINKADLVLLLEDDGFIFEKGAVNENFQKIESDLCDAVGSPRFSCGQEIGEASRTKYGLDYSGYGDMGCNFWPNFFFCKRKDLLKTDLNCASKTFQKGEYCKELDYIFKEINHGDTFVWASIQLRAMGLRFHTIPQHKADPFEIDSKEKKEQNWHSSQQPFKWIHGGSLSAGWGGYLSGRIPDVSNDSAKQEMESRVAFWQLASDICDIDLFDDIASDDMKAFYISYKQGIEDLIKNVGLNKARIDQKIQIYKKLMNL